MESFYVNWGGDFIGGFLGLYGVFRGGKAGVFLGEWSFWRVVDFDFGAMVMNEGERKDRMKERKIDR